MLFKEVRCWCLNRKTLKCDWKVCCKKLVMELWVLIYNMTEVWLKYCLNVSILYFLHIRSICKILYKIFWKDRIAASKVPWSVLSLPFMKMLYYITVIYLEYIFPLKMYKPQTDKWMTVLISCVHKALSLMCFCPLMHSNHPSCLHCRFYYSSTNKKAYYSDLDITVKDLLCESDFKTTAALYWIWGRKCYWVLLWYLAHLLQAGMSASNAHSFVTFMIWFTLSVRCFALCSPSSFWTRDAL